MNPSVSPDVVFVLPELKVGGAERVTLTFANALVDRGLETEILLLGEPGALAGEVKPKVRVTALHAPRFRHSLRPLCRHLANTRPRSILAAMPPVTSLAVAARALTGLPARVVIAEHFDWSARRGVPPDPTRLGFKLQMWMAYHGADARVAVSEGVARTAARIARISPRKIEVVVNPVTPLAPAAPPDPAILDPWLARPGRKLIAVGVFKPAKDFPTLFRAVARVRETTPVSLLLLGDGAQRAELEQLRAELGLEDCVAMPGVVPNPRAYLERADLFVLSSTGEGLPTVLIEALACGAPVVSTDSPSGPREILEAGRYGVLAPVSNPDALAAAMLESLGREHDRAALVRRSLDFSVDKAVEKYLALLLPRQFQPTAESATLAGAVR
ncbi:MAG TPA: glycosyltransferase [Caulobacteraceae bacterium]|nr:glycosyltransferase [Caulobacteraceae bacterium]